MQRILLTSLLLVIANANAAVIRIETAADASRLERLAAQEVQRYIYLRASIVPVLSPAAGTTAGDIIVLRKDRPRVAQSGLKAEADKLAPQEFLLRTVGTGDDRHLWIIGGDDLGTLYGAYRLAEKLGVRFGLDQDVIPDQRLEWRLPILDEVGKPRFSLRGLQPFHDFKEGPDWWNLADYETVLSQMAKLRMNFIGFHTYPSWNGMGPEANVWIGLPEDVDENGNVRSAYRAGLATSRVNWGSVNPNPYPTSRYAAGAGLLFEGEEYTADFMEEWPEWPKAETDCVTLFNRYGDMQKKIFEHARQIGVKVCIGTETPMGIPKELQERLKMKGMDPTDPKVVQQLYEGMFLRLMRKSPVDYYWLWTPEIWMGGEGVKGWEITTKENTERDLKLAGAAAKAVSAPFGMATCGWLLGTAGDRLWCDQRVPKSWAAASIICGLGRQPIDPEYAAISGRSKWVIPWSEDDGMTMADTALWVERMFADALDAKRYGCDGLMTIHWRTSEINPNVAALSRASWDYSDEPSLDDDKKLYSLGGRTAVNTQPIAGAQDQTIYQTVRYRFGGYHLRTPNGLYKVKLQFCEWEKDAAGQRLFDVNLQGKPVLEKLDLFAAAGKNAALDKQFQNIEVKDGWLAVELTPRVGETCLAGLVVEWQDQAAPRGAAASLPNYTVEAQVPGNRAETQAPFKVLVNCGGLAHGDYVADPVAQRGRVKELDVYWQEWGRAWFGPEGGAQAGKALQGFDGKSVDIFNLISAGKRSTDAEIEAALAPLKQVESAASAIQGAGNRARFDFWLNLCRAQHHRMYAWTRSYRMEDAMKQCRELKEPEKKKAFVEEQVLPLRLQLARTWENMIAAYVAVANTPGDLGVLTTLSGGGDGQVAGHDGEISAILGKPLPAEYAVSTAYSGAPRLYVPGKPSQLRAGEPHEIRVSVLSRSKGAKVTLHWRRLGEGDFQKVAGTHVARQAYRVQLPPLNEGTVEYYLEAGLEEGTRIVWPVSAPAINHTAIVMPATP